MLSAAISSGAHDPGDGQHAHLAVDARLLRAADQQVAVGQNLGNDGRDEQMQLLGATDRPLALGAGRPAGVEAAGGVAGLIRHAEAAEAEIERRTMPLALAFLRPAAGVVELRLVVDVDRTVTMSPTLRARRSRKRPWSVWLHSELARSNVRLGERRGQRGALDGRGPGRPPTAAACRPLIGSLIGVAGRRGRPKPAG